MLDRASILATIEKAYAARCADDKAEALRDFAPGATFRVVSSANEAAALNRAGASAEESIDALIDTFQFHAMELQEAMVDGLKAATLRRAQVSVRGGEPVETELAEFWTFDEAGRIVSLIQLVDTALAAQMLR